MTRLFQCDQCKKTEPFYNLEDINFSVKLNIEQVISVGEFCSKDCMFKYLSTHLFEKKFEPINSPVQVPKLVIKAEKKETAGEFLKRKREEKRYSQAYIAKYLRECSVNVFPSYISRIETGKTRLPSYYVPHLAKLFGVEEYWFQD